MDQKPAHLGVIDPEKLSFVSTAAPVAKMMQAVIDKGISQENVAVMEKLVELYERMEAKDAEKQFAVAFRNLQSEIPVIIADRDVPDRNGNLRYKFAAYEDVMEKVRPLLERHGFTVSFSMTYGDARVIQHCTLQHTGGHSRTNQFAVRAGDGPPGASASQADGAAATYAKRFALCAALNITIERGDTDAAPQDVKLEGEPITPEQVIYLKEQVKDTGANEVRFLEMAGVKTYEEITQGSYKVLTRSLQMKRR